MLLTVINPGRRYASISRLMSSVHSHGHLLMEDTPTNSIRPHEYEMIRSIHANPRGSIPMSIDNQSHACSSLAHLALS